MDNRQKVISNLIWRFMERCGAQLVSFAVAVVLARLIEPELFGLIATVTVITSILLVFADSGMANALIQKKDPDDLDFSSVFFFNIVFCVAIYAALYFAAPWLAKLYKAPSLVVILRVLGLTIIVAGIKNVQQAYVSKTLQFKRFFFATLGGTVLSGIVGIAMALMGYGIWALVAKELVNVTVNTAILWLTVGWRPKLMFSFRRLVKLLDFGWKLLVSGLLDNIYNKLRQIIIGIKYSSADLAFYDRGNSLPNLIVENVNSSIDSVLLPVLSTEQDSAEQVRRMTRRAIKVSTYIMMPLMMGLAVCAEPLIRLLLTEKWLPCVPYLRIFCFTYAFYPVHTANLNAIKAMGRSDLFLILEIIKKGIGIVALVATVNLGVYAMALSLLAVALISQVINAWPNQKLLGYAYPQQFLDMLPAMVLTLVMGACVYPISFLQLSDWIVLPLQVLAGVAVYVLLSALFKVDSFQYMLGIIKRIKER